MSGEDRRAGWQEYQELVLNELKNLREANVRINDKLDSIKDENRETVANMLREANERITAIKIDIATMKGQAILLGAISGVIVSGLITHFLK